MSEMAAVNSYLTLFDEFVAEPLFISVGVKVTVEMTAVVVDVPVTFDVISLNFLSVFAVVGFSCAAKSIAFTLTLLLLAVTDAIDAGLGFFATAVVGSFIAGLDVFSVGFLFSFGFRSASFRNSRRNSSKRIQLCGHSGMRCSLKYVSMYS